MKKTLLFVSALFAFMLCDAQVKTHSNYDVDGDGSVTVADVTKTVNRVTEKLSDDRTVVDGESLNATLQEILLQLKSLKEQIAELKNKSCSCSCNGSSSGSNATAEGYDPYKGHKYVDLGLSVKWATCNIGAESPEEYGDYFAWGATTPQDVYDWAHAPYQTQNTTDYSSTKWTKYVGSTSSPYKDTNATDEDALKTVLDPEDDAAHVNWKGIWRMPTEEEMDELRNNCYWQHVSTYNGKEVDGYIVYKAKSDSDKGRQTDQDKPDIYSISDPHIFFPAAGYRRDGSFYNESYGIYWTSSVYPDMKHVAQALLFYPYIVYWSSYDNRGNGLPIRPVCP